MDDSFDAALCITYHYISTLLFANNVTLRILVPLSIWLAIAK